MTETAQHNTLGGTRLAYLVGQYPAINHTFVLREVLQLRALGCDLHLASVLPADRPAHELTETERAEARQTYYIKFTNPLKLAGPHLKTFMARPVRYLRMLAHTLAQCLAAPRMAHSTLMYFSEAVVLGQWMQAQGLTHVHTHFASSVCLLAARLFPITMSMTIHGPAEFDDPVGFQLAAKVRAAAFVCAISNYARSQLMRYTAPAEWGKIEVAPLGVDPALYAPRPLRAARTPYEIVFVGRLAPVKAPHVLVAAIAQLVGAGRDVRLRFVGNGPLRSSLETDVSERGLAQRVSFMGWLDQAQVRAVYEDADIFALASFAEGVPVVLMEAMAREIPCVATFVNGIPELIRHEVDGLLVAPSDATQLAAAIARLLDDAALRRRLGAAGRQRVLEKYDLQRNVQQLANIFRRRLAPKPAADAVYPLAVAPARPAATKSGSGREEQEKLLAG